MMTIIDNQTCRGYHADITQENCFLADAGCSPANSPWSVVQQPTLSGKGEHAKRDADVDCSFKPFCRAVGYFHLGHCLYSLRQKNNMFSAEGGCHFGDHNDFHHGECHIQQCHHDPFNAQGAFSFVWLLAMRQISMVLHRVTVGT